jgi:exodeoxyribonuclease VII large subunit
LLVSANGAKFDIRRLPMTVTAHISLSQLTGLIRETLEHAFRGRSFWVVADVTNHSYKETTNYHYFELVEKIPGKGDILAKIAAKAWGEGSARIAAFEKATGQRFTSNIRVLVNVGVVYHPKWGLQLELNDLDTRFTLGAIEEQRQATLRKLVTDNPGVVQLVDGNYITQNQQLRLPAVIQTIALVSALQSAGAEDFRHTLEHNDHGYRFRIDEYHTAVQGENNAEAFVDCLVSVFNSAIPYDVVVITRGGGAQSDFLIFDHYMIGLAVAKFPVPVVTGIGHQKNETIADLMAHTALKTPTKAAEFIIAHNKSFEDKILTLQKAVVIRSQQMLSHGFRELATLKSSIVNQTRDILSREKDDLGRLHQTVTSQAQDILYSRKGEILRTASMLASRPASILSNRQNDLRHLVGNLRTFNAQYLKNQRGYIGHWQSLVKTMSPDNILKKGFALVKVEGRITSNPGDLTLGKDIDIILSDTTITSTVISKTPYHGDEFNI